MFLQEHFAVQCGTDISIRTSLNRMETTSYEDCIFPFEATPSLRGRASS
jgi:hypothetical protein